MKSTEHTTMLVPYFVEGARVQRLSRGPEAAERRSLVDDADAGWISAFDPAGEERPRCLRRTGEQSDDAEAAIAIGA